MHNLTFSLNIYLPIYMSLSQNITPKSQYGWFYLTRKPSLPLSLSVHNFSDNLKTLFRPISMMLPDLHRIAEIELLSHGYENAKSLGTKIVTMFQLCKEQLIAQPHYDFGMRTMKTVLEMSERAKVNGSATKADEESCVIEIIRQTILCTLDDQDVHIFEVKRAKTFGQKPSVRIFRKR